MSKKLINSSPHLQYTIEDWEKIPQSKKSDLINGEILFQASPKREHSLVQSALAGHLFSLVAKILSNGEFEKNKWIIGTEIGVIYNQQNAFTHDLAGWRTDRIIDIDLSKNMNVVPDWVCEIVSSNWKTDTILKREILQKYKVPYYWLINPKHRSISVLELTQLGIYQLLADFKITTECIVNIPPFENIELDLKNIFLY